MPYIRTITFVHLILPTLKDQPAIGAVAPQKGIFKIWVAARGLEIVVYVSRTSGVDDGKGLVDAFTALGVGSGVEEKKQNKKGQNLSHGIGFSYLRGPLKWVGYWVY